MCDSKGCPFYSNGKPKTARAGADEMAQDAANLIDDWRRRGNEESTAGMVIIRSGCPHRREQLVIGEVCPGR